MFYISSLSRTNIMYTNKTNSDIEILIQNVTYISTQINICLYLDNIFLNTSVFYVLEIM